MSGAHERIDAHLHLWDLDVSEYGWLDESDGELFTSFAPERARAELDAAGIDRAVLVQAEDSLRDTEYLLAVASEQPWVAGVVGWVQLDDPALAETTLERWHEHGHVVGIRHLVHVDRRPDFLDLPTVRESLREVAIRGLAFDVPDAWPAHLDAAIRVAKALPDLTVVLDHLAKPPRGSARYAEWERTFREAGELPNTVAKFSGLQTPEAPFTVDTLRGVWDVALEAFGPHRLMYGGDWPMTLPAGGYLPTWQVLSTLIGELSAREQDLILGRTASRVYHLPEPQAG